MTSRRRHHQRDMLSTCISHHKETSQVYQETALVDNCKTSCFAVLIAQAMSISRTVFRPLSLSLPHLCLMLLVLITRQAHYPIWPSLARFVPRNMRQDKTGINVGRRALKTPCKQSTQQLLQSRGRRYPHYVFRQYSVQRQNQLSACIFAFVVLVPKRFAQKTKKNRLAGKKNCCPPFLIPRYRGNCRPRPGNQERFI